MAYLQFLGAAGTVTGSKHLINTRDDSSHQPGIQVLIDCGLFQGQKEWRLRNWEDTPVPAHDIDAVILRAQQRFARDFEQYPPVSRRFSHDVSVPRRLQ